MRSLLAVPVLALCALLLGCSDSDDPVGPGASLAAVRVAHLSPDAPAVDVWVDGERVLGGVPFKAVSDYLVVPVGSHRIQVTPANATVPVVIDATLTFAAGSATTIAATGLLSDLEPIVLSDELDAPGNAARVRFVHASPDAPAVDITANGGPVVFSNVAFREFEGYGSVGPGTYSLQVRPAGQTPVVLNLEGITFAAGRAYTAFAVGRLADGSLGAVLVEDDF